MFGISGAALIIIAVAIITPSAGWWYSSNEYRVCKAEYDGFQATTEAQGKLADKGRVETEMNLANAAVAIQGDLNAKQLELNRTYADYERMRRANQRNTSSRQASQTTTSTVGLNCPNPRAEFDSAMGAVEDAGLIEILKSRDEAINRTIGCKAYLDKLQQILNGGDHAVLNPE